MENEITLLPVLIKVKSFVDLIKVLGTGIIYHIHLKDKKHFYYFYSVIGEPVVITLFGIITTEPHKKYVGIVKNKLIETDYPSSDTPLAIVEIEDDPIAIVSINGVDIH